MLSEVSTALLNEKYEKYNRPNFIEFDPISIPHKFSLKQDIEISGFFAATFAWGQRVTIIKKCEELLERMDQKPFDFILNHSNRDLKNLEGFKHRTFNYTDLLYFVEFLKTHYQLNESLESAFLNKKEADVYSAKHALINFNKIFFSLEDFPNRTKKHVSSPMKNSACKRLNMYLRWMVRDDDKGVDFGIWKKIKPWQLICPCDVHVENTAKILGMTSRLNSDWVMAEEITNVLLELDPLDPVKYDFAMFGLGIEKYFGGSIDTKN